MTGGEKLSPVDDVYNQEISSLPTLFYLKNKKKTGRRKDVCRDVDLPCYYDCIIKLLLQLITKVPIVPNVGSGSKLNCRLLTDVSHFSFYLKIEINFSYLPVYFRSPEIRLCSRRYVTFRSSVRFLEDESIFLDCAKRFSSTWSDRGTRVEEQGKRMRE